MALRRIGLVHTHTFTYTQYWLSLQMSGNLTVWWQEYDRNWQWSRCFLLPAVRPHLVAFFVAAVCCLVMKYTGRTARDKCCPKMTSNAINLFLKSSGFLLRSCGVWLDYAVLGHSVRLPESSLALSRLCNVGHANYVCDSLPRPNIGHVFTRWAVFDISCLDAPVLNFSRCWF